MREGVVEFIRDLVEEFKNKLADQLRLNFDFATGKSMATLRVMEIQDEIAEKGGYSAESSVSNYITDRVCKRLIEEVQYGDWVVDFDGSEIEVTAKRNL